MKLTLMPASFRSVARLKAAALHGSVQGTGAGVW